MSLVCIAESINIMSNTIGPAMKERNPEPIQNMAKEEAAAGADLLDINIGPARKGGAEMMEWLVKTVQEVTDVPLALDTTNLDAMDGGLKVHKGRPLMNSVSLQENRLEKGIKMAAQYGADVIGLLWGQDGMPRDADERAMHAAEFYMKATEAGISPERIWIDPIASPISVDINQVKSCIDFMAVLQDVAPEVKSTVGLSNISNGVPDDLRCWLDRVYLCMLMHNGQYSAIMNSYDQVLMDIAKDKRPDIMELTVSVMEGGDVNTDDLSDEMLKYHKTAKVLTGEVLFSNAWLE